MGILIHAPGQLFCNGFGEVYIFLQSCDVNLEQTTRVFLALSVPSRSVEPTLAHFTGLWVTLYPWHCITIATNSFNQYSCNYPTGTCLRYCIRWACVNTLTQLHNTCIPSHTILSHLVCPEAISHASPGHNGITVTRKINCSVIHIPLNV